MRFKITILSLIFIFGSLNIYAQQNDSLKNIDIDKIVINASKSNSKYKDLPVAISVLSEKNIQASEVKTLTDISALVPNFFMPDYGSKLTTPVYIRGIGSRINSPSVGLYVDGVPYFEKAAFAFDFFDIKQIEVLSGPQGTLFGRNTMGGLINITTLSPFDYTGLRIDATAGSYGQYKVNAGYYGKIKDKFGYTISANYVRNDGFYENAYNGNMIDELDSYGLRNKLIWKVTDNISFENIASFERSEQGGYPYAIYDDSLQQANDINYNQFSGYKRDLFSDAFVAKFSGKHVEFVSTTSTQFLEDLQEIDQDFTADSLYYVSQYQKQNMYSQDFVLRSKDTKYYDWIVGAYGFQQIFDRKVDVDIYPKNMAYTKKYDHEITGGALYHQSTLKNFPVKNLSLTAGVRFDTEKDILYYKYDLFMGGNTIPQADTTYPQLDYFQILPKFAINYKINNTAIYATVAKGYKTGGFNSTFERDEDLTFLPEFSWNYEIGTKATINKKLYVNAAIFYIDWQNQQIYQTVPSGRGSMLKNAGKSVSQGGEISMFAKLTKTCNASLSYGYTDAKFTLHELNDSVNYNGNRIPYVPMHTFSANISKEILFKQNKVIDKMVLGVMYRGNGDIYWNEENTSYQKYYNLLDAKISFVRKNVQFDLWGKNLLNEKYNSFYFEALGNQYVQIGRPLNFGANLSIKF